MKTLARTALLALLAGLALGGCTAPSVAGASTTTAQVSAGQRQPATIETFKALNHLTWGANTAAVEKVQGIRLDQYLSRQLHPSSARLLPAVQAQIDGMTISQRPMIELAQEMTQRRKDAAALTDDDEKKAALQAWQRGMN